MATADPKPYARRIAVFCSLLGGGCAAFWSTQILRGQVSRHHDAQLQLSILWFAVFGFGFVWMKWRKWEKAIGRPASSMLLLSSLFRFVLNSNDNQGLGLAGLVTFAAAIVLWVVANGVYPRQSAAQPGDEPDGPPAGGRSHR